MNTPKNIYHEEPEDGKQYLVWDAFTGSWKLRRWTHFEEPIRDIPGQWGNEFEVFSEGVAAKRVRLCATYYELPNTQPVKEAAV